MLTLPSLTTLPTTTTPASTTQPPPIRVPTGLFEPVNYDLTIKAFFEPFAGSIESIDVDAERFEGKVIIELLINNSTNSIVLHSDRTLILNNGTLRLVNAVTSANVAITGYTYLPNQLVSFALGQTVSAGRYLLTIEFARALGSTSNLNGFFRSRYREEFSVK